MIAIDDGFADARASQISLINKFTVVYQDSAIKNTPDFGINFPSVWKEVKCWVSAGSSRKKQPICDQLSGNGEFESRYISNLSENRNWVEKTMKKFHKVRIKRMATKHLHNFEKSFVHYNEFFEDWKKKEEIRFVELDIYISDQGRSLEPNQFDRVMETSHSFKGIVEELAPKFRQIIERLEELSQAISNYDLIVSKQYEDLVVKAELSFGDQIEELLDFSDSYRGLASSNDPNNKVVKVFDDIDSLCAYIETV